MDDGETHKTQLPVFPTDRSSEISRPGRRGQITPVTVRHVSHSPHIFWVEKKKKPLRPRPSLLLHFESRFFRLRSGVTDRPMTPPPSSSFSKKNLTQKRKRSVFPFQMQHKKENPLFLVKTCEFEPPGLEEGDILGG